MTKKNVGEIAVLGSLILAIICTLASALWVYAGTYSKANNALNVAEEENERSHSNEREICGIRAEIKATHEDVLIIKKHVLER